VDQPSTEAERPALSEWPTLVAAATAGAATMIAELSATRLLAPWFGASIHAWTHVIATVLGAMAVGYAVGSRLAETANVGVVMRAWIGGGVLLAIAPFVAPILAPALVPPPESQTPLTIAADAAWGSFVTTLVLFAPALLMLGVSTPVLIRLLSRGPSGPGAAGRVLAASTIGSLVGTYLPAFFLLENLGSRGSILAAAAGCFLAAGLAGGARLRGVATFVAGVGILLCPRVPFGPLVPSEGAHTLVAEHESAYQYVRVSTLPVGDDVATHLLARRGPRRIPFAQNGATADDRRLLRRPRSGPGSRSRSVVRRRARDRGGAGTLRGLLRTLRPERVRSVTDVELDPSVAGLSWRFGGVPAPDDAVIIGDGRAALRALRGPFDVIVLDAYARQAAIPAHLGTVESFTLMRDRLSRRGIVAINASLADVDSPLGRALVATLLEVFPEVKTVGVPGSWNVQFLAGPGLPPTPDLKDRGDALDTARGWVRTGWSTRSKASKGAIILTDDCAPSKPWRGACVEPSPRNRRGAAVLVGGLSAQTPCAGLKLAPRRSQPRRRAVGVLDASSDPASRSAAGEAEGLLAEAGLGDRAGFDARSRRPRGSRERSRLTLLWGVPQTPATPRRGRRRAPACGRRG
jgi:predicted membrane-bound spermidine synthase